MLTMTEVVAKRAAVEKQLADEAEAYKKQRLMLEMELLSLRKLEAAGEVLVGDVQLARDLLDIDGTANVGERPERVKVLREAAEDLIENQRTLRHSYFGVKNYDRFGDQREDHPYGYKPRHGHVVFSVGLRPSHRARFLKPHERDACVRVLTAMAEGKLTEL